jgi:hypothetical protein
MVGTLNFKNLNKKNRKVFVKSFDFKLSATKSYLTMFSKEISEIS